MLALAALGCGCSTNPTTGRDQIVSHPAVQAYADIGFAIQTGAEGMANGQYCDQRCLDRQKFFAEQVARIGAELAAAARDMSPEVFTRIEEFQIKVYNEWGTGTGSSATGRIAIGAGLAQLEPTDDVTAFMLAREMAHVIARHGEEDSLARIVVSAVSTILPVYNLVAKFFASTVGSGAITSSWAGTQQREADDIALALLERTGRSAARVAESLADGLKKVRLPEGDWTKRYVESTERVMQVASLAPLGPAAQRP